MQQRWENLGTELRRVAKWAYVKVAFGGDAVTCPLCDGRFSRFRDYSGRSGAECPMCGALERHRLLWLFLDREILTGPRSHRVLHVAPEPSVSGRLSDRAARYVSFDLENPASDIHGDLTCAPFPDGSFDLIVCSHVLEHIVDDVRAAQELGRVLAPGGLAVIQVPVDVDREATYEDPDIIDPDERLRAFGQRDHVRIYGRDIEHRLDDAGLNVTRVDYREALAAEAVRFGATAEETLYVCTTER